MSCSGRHVERERVCSSFGQFLDSIPVLCFFPTRHLCCWAARVYKTCRDPVVICATVCVTRDRVVVGPHTNMFGTLPWRSAEICVMLSFRLGWRSSSRTILTNWISRSTCRRSVIIVSKIGSIGGVWCCKCRDAVRRHVLPGVHCSSSLETQAPRHYPPDQYIHLLIPTFVECLLCTNQELQHIIKSSLTGP